MQFLRNFFESVESQAAHSDSEVFYVTKEASLFGNKETIKLLTDDYLITFDRQTRQIELESDASIVLGNVEALTAKILRNARF